MARTPKTTTHTVTAVSGVRPGSPLDRLFNHGECLTPGCGGQAPAPDVLCASHKAAAEANH